MDSGGVSLIETTKMENRNLFSRSLLLLFYCSLSLFLLSMKEQSVVLDNKAENSLATSKEIAPCPLQCQTSTDCFVFYFYFYLAFHLKAFNVGEKGD